MAGFAHGVATRPSATTDSGLFSLLGRRLPSSASELGAVGPRAPSASSASSAAWLPFRHAARISSSRLGISQKASVYDTSSPDREVVNIGDPLLRKTEFPPPYRWHRPGSTLLKKPGLLPHPLAVAGAPKDGERVTCPAVFDLAVISRRGQRAVAASATSGNHVAEDYEARKRAHLQTFLSLVAEATASRRLGAALGASWPGCGSVLQGRNGCLAGLAVASPGGGLLARRPCCAARHDRAKDASRPLRSVIPLGEAHWSAREIGRLPSACCGRPAPCFPVGR